VVDVLKRFFGTQDDLEVTASLTKQAFEIAAEDRRHKEERQEEWSGVLADYIGLVGKNPNAGETTRERIYRVAFQEPGYTLITHESHPRLARSLGLPANGAKRQHNAFQDFFGAGVIDVIDDIAGFVENGMRGGEAARQIAFLLSDTGAGKTQFVRRIGNLLVGQTLYALKECPMHEHPFRALQKSRREFWADKVGRPIDLEADLCPKCQWLLEHKYHHRWEKMPVTTVRLSRRRRIGIVTAFPLDPNTTDNRVLVGGDSLRLLMDLEEGDPRLMNFFGLFNHGEGGMLEGVEFFKNPSDALHIYITQTTEGEIPSPGFYRQVSSDVFVIAHTNWGDYERFKLAGNEAIMDRMQTFVFPYVLSYQDLAEQLYPKMLSRAKPSGVHFSPLALEATARFQVVSARQREREEDGGQHIPLDPWVELRNGTKISSDIDVRHVNSIYPHDGRKGVSPRLSVKALESCESDLAIGYGEDRDPKHKCVSPEMVLDELIPRVRSFYEGPRNEETQKDNLDTLKTYIPRILKERTGEILALLLSVPRVKERVALAVQDNLYGMSRRYFGLIQQERDHIHGTLTLQGEITPKLSDRDYAFLDRIESRLGLALGARPKFREELLAFKKQAEERGEALDLSAHADFRTALSETFFDQSQKALEALYEKMREDETLSAFFAEELTRLGAKRDDTKEGTGVLRPSWCPACALKLVEYAATRAWQM